MVSLPAAVSLFQFYMLHVFPGCSVLWYFFRFYIPLVIPFVFVCFTFFLSDKYGCWVTTGRLLVMWMPTEKKAIEGVLFLSNSTWNCLVQKNFLIIANHYDDMECNNSERTAAGFMSMFWRVKHAYVCSWLQWVRWPVLPWKLCCLHCAWLCYLHHF